YLIDECYVLSVGGLGHADRIAEDRERDLVLLRVHGAGDLPTLALAPDEASDVVIAGIADPQAQAGGSAVSTARGRVAAAPGGGARAIEPPPPAGFAGAAAVDAEGRVVGMVQLRVRLLAGP